MLTFYQPRRWVLPALASKKDLLLLEQIHKLQPTDEKSKRKLRLLVHDFHQANYLSTIGCVVGLLVTALLIYTCFDKLVHPTKDTLILAAVIASSLAVIPLCGLIRLLGMWFVRKKYNKFKKDHTQSKAHIGGQVVS
jgi:hypothetical protein